MKVLFLTNNNLSYSLYNWLVNCEKEIVTLFDGKIDIEYINQVKPEYIISYNYKHIISSDIINYMEGKVLNLHISYLPWNRGASPNFWSFIDNTPKGVTIHLIDASLDTGKILLQKEVFFNEDKETLKTTYYKLHKEIQVLFKDNWNLIKNNLIEPFEQIGEGSIHFVKDFEKVTKLVESDIYNINVKELKQIIMNRGNV